MGIIKRFVIHSKVLEITIGMIVAVAFERVVSSMVSGILMPLIRAFTNETMGDYKTIIGGAIVPSPSNEVVIVEYGRFIEAVIVFLIILYFIAKAIRIVELHRRKEGLEPKDAPSGSDQII
jgi:large conductance mechanosensitive channel